MTRRLTGALLVLPMVTGLLISCGPDERPELRLERMRNAHEIIPVGRTVLRDDEGAPSLLIDLQVTNQGTEPLPQLTVLVRATNAAGVNQATERVTLDLEGQRPGIGERHSIRLPGLDETSASEVMVEIEAGLSDEDLRSLPEWQAVAPVSG